MEVNRWQDGEKRRDFGEGVCRNWQKTANPIQAAARSGIAKPADELQRNDDGGIEPDSAIVILPTIPPLPAQGAGETT